MKPIKLSELADLLDGELHGDPNRVAMGWALDNRDVKLNQAFLAIQGNRVDGHDFVNDALVKGAAVAIVERPVDGSHILVRNLVEALARMAAKLRKRANVPVIGITGSAGKTSTKELIACALSSLGPVLKTEGNRNTEYTAPLLWTDFMDDKAVVVEMAMRGFGQIRHLASFAKPTIGVVTNIGYSHLEMVKTREGIALAKSELLEGLPSDGHAVIWAEDEFADQLRKLSNAPVSTFGLSENADCHITKYRPIGWTGSEIEGVVFGQEWRAILPVLGRHFALNAAAAVLVAHHCGVRPRIAGQSLVDAILPPMRMEIRDVKGVKILLDNYNASPPSMLAAIEALDEAELKGKRYAVIGEMRELGDFAEEAHRQVGQALARSKVESVVLYGGPTRFIQEEIEAAAGAKLVRTAGSLDEIKAFLESLHEGDAVLVKGSRALELEKAVPA